MVRQIDILPTVTDIVRIPLLSPSVQGCPLKRATDCQELAPEPAYVEACGITLRSKMDWPAAIRTEEWKYVRGLNNELARETLQSQERPG